MRLAPCAALLFDDARAMPAPKTALALFLSAKSRISRGRGRFFGLCLPAESWDEFPAAALAAFLFAAASFFLYFDVLEEMPWRVTLYAAPP